MEIYHLVHSLNKSEKRYLKLFSSLQTGSKVYIRLFNEIAKQKIYDEKKLKEKLKIKAYPMAKTYLYSLIMKSLRSQQSNQNVNMQIRILLNDIEILFQKGLYNQTYKLLVKAKKLAKKHEKFPLLMEVSQLEYLIANITINTSEHKRLLKDNLKEANLTMKKYMEQMEHRRIMNIMINKRYVSGKRFRNEAERKKFYREAGELIEKDPKLLLSYKTGIFNYNIKEHYYYNIHDIEGAYQNTKNAIKYMEANPTLLLEELHNYMLPINNLLHAQLLRQQYEEMKVGINKLKLLEKNATTINSKARAFGLYASKEITYFVRTNRYKEGLAFVPFIESQLSKYKQKVNTLSRYTIYASIIELYFVCKKYKDALYWNNKMLNDSEIKLFYDYYCNSRIAEIIIHYELENIEKVQSLIKSLYLFLVKNKAKNKYENSLIRFFKKLIAVASSKELKEEFIRFRKELIKLSDDPYETNIFDFFDIISWLESKIGNRPFAIIMKEKTGK